MFVSEEDLNNIQFVVKERQYFNTYSERQEREKNNKKENKEKCDMCGGSEMTISLSMFCMPGICLRCNGTGEI